MGDDLPRPYAQPPRCARPSSVLRRGRRSAPDVREVTAAPRATAALKNDAVLGMSAQRYWRAPDTPEPRGARTNPGRHLPMDARAGPLADVSFGLVDRLSPVIQSL